MESKYTHHSGAGNTSGTNVDARRTETAKRARQEAQGGNMHGGKRYAQAAAKSVRHAGGKKQRSGRDVPVRGAAQAARRMDDSSGALSLVAEEAGVTTKLRHRVPPSVTSVAPEGGVTLRRFAT